MFRHLPFGLSLGVAFAAGFWLMPGPSGHDTGAPDISALAPLGHSPHSSHAKTRFAEQVARAAKRNRLPPPAFARRDGAGLAALAPGWSTRLLPPDATRPAPTLRPHTQLASFASAPFPYDGAVPRTNRPFLTSDEDGRRYHETFSGRVYWADETYSDNRVLLHVPAGFDPARPGVLVVFFHGHGATLERDVATRQRLPQQITDSGVNAVLAAPQFAVDARDSSAGNLWQPGGLRRFLDETADRLAEAHGGQEARRAFARMPVVLVGYSGGYNPAAWALARGGASERIRGVVLLDGLYGEVGTFARWIERNRGGFFLSAYTASTRRGNEALKAMLAARGLPYATELGAEIAPGSVTFLAADEEHRGYVTRAWTDNPVSDLLMRLPGVAPRAPVALSAALTAGAR